MFITLSVTRVDNDENNLNNSSNCSTLYWHFKHPRVMALSYISMRMIHMHWPARRVGISWSICMWCGRARARMSWR